MKQVARSLWLILGLVCVALGTLGVILPGLPATCFFIAASAAFTKGSPALRRKLLAHPRVGPGLRYWQEHRAMPLRAKGWALASMWLGMLPSLWLTARLSAWLPWVVLAAGAIGSAVVLFGVATSTSSAVRPAA